MNNPAVSVILPVFNSAATLDATIASVLQQNFDDFELIAINDGSSDGSLKILLDHADCDDRIRVASQTNRGVAVTRNLGAMLARGDLLAFLDADDIWHPEKLARHVDFHARHPHADVSYGRIAFLGTEPSGRSLTRTTSSISPGYLTVTELLAENPVCTMSNLVVTAEAFARVGGFRQGMSFAEDQEWLARAADMFCTIEGINEVLVDYRLSPDGLSVNLDRMYDGWRSIAEAYRSSADVDRAEAVYCRYLARRALRAGASAKTAWHFARRGVTIHSGAFLADAKRGWMTLLCAAVSHLLPRRARLFLFA